MSQSDDTAQKDHNLDFIIEELSRLPDLVDIPRRIELYQQALQLAKRDDEYELWGTLQIAIGNTLTSSLLGDRNENLEQAIAAYQQALTVFSQETLPIE